MTKEKQIEEVVKDFCPLYQEYGSCKLCNQSLDVDDEPCYYGCVANIIIDYGYRKSEEVAREVIDETLRYIDTHKDFIAPIPMQSLIEFGEFLGELEKKYTEGEG